MSELKVRWIGEMDLMAYDDQGHSYIMSNSEYSGGVKKGVSAMESILYGLAGCTGLDVVAILKKKGNELRDMEIKIEAKRAEKHPKVYTEIDLYFDIYGDVKPEDAGRSIELSRDKFCSVSAMLRNGGVKIRLHARVNGEEIEIPGEEREN